MSDRAFLDFSPDNFPYGIFYHKSDPNKCRYVGSRLFNQVIDLYKLFREPYFKSDYLNVFISAGSSVWSKTRSELQTLCQLDDERLKSCMVDIDQVEMCTPIHAPNFTDFNSSIYHATNVGKLFRPDAPLNPNWLTIPTGYHGRASSVTKDGIVQRPSGMIQNEYGKVKLMPSRKLDIELELGTVIGRSNNLGEPIPIHEASSYIFGFVLLNDWSARDIQAWEYVPLGPFIGKNFRTTISPWIVTYEALQPFICPNPEPHESPNYLQEKDHYHMDINLEFRMKTESMNNFDLLTKTNSKHLYWSVPQQIAHHTVGGCNLQIGDIIGTGTISGPERDQVGSLIELSANGTKPFVLSSGEKRNFVDNGDSVAFYGYADNGKIRVGFGELVDQVIQ